MLKSKDMLGLFLNLELLSDDDPILAQRVLTDERDDSWWEGYKGAVFAYGLMAGVTIFIIIPWFVGIVMSIKWIFF